MRYNYGKNEKQNFFVRRLRNGNHCRNRCGKSGGGCVAYCSKGSTKSPAWRDALYDAVIAAGGLRGNRANPKQEKKFDILALSYMPAVLMEYGYMDSTADAPVILTDAYAKKVAQGTMAGIAKAAGLKKKAAPEVKPQAAPQPTVTWKTENGKLIISANVYSDIAGTAASNCFGVKGMAARSVKDGVYHLLRKESASKGVRVRFFEDDSIAIDLHIIVDNGVNLTTLGESIISRVRYEVNKYTGTQVRAVNVYIDSMMIG